MEKIWLKSYPKDVPAEINPDVCESINEMFNQACQQYADRPALHNMGVTLSYAELSESVKQFAAYLQQQLKLKPGARLAIMLPNTLQYPVIMYAALKAGLVVVNVNPLYTADELVYQLNDAGVEVLVALENFADTVQKALPRIPSLNQVIITRLGDLFPAYKACLTHWVLKYYYKKIPSYSLPQAVFFNKALELGQALTFTPVAVTNTDTAFLQYTGGTTGISKGAILTHRNIIANMQQALSWFDCMLTPGKEIIITALPLYHIFSLLANCILFTRMGALSVLITNPRDIPRMIKDMSRFQFTAITGVNTLFNALLNNPAFAKLDFSRLRLTVGGGMAVQHSVAEKWQQVTGAPLLEAYGLTETSPCAIVNPPYLKSYNGTIGLPISSTDVAILDDEGHELPIGTPGELGIKGPQVMQGYWQNPSETAKVFTKDGWLLTGDIAAMDEKGYLRILERKKDMILVSGFNVYPNEIEDVLAEMPGVRECAVIGVPDEHSGEAVKAYIVKNDPHLSVDAVIKFCREHLTPYKVPRQVEFRSELPKTNVGKILKRALRINSESSRVY